MPSTYAFREYFSRQAIPERWELISWLLILLPMAGFSMTHPYLKTRQGELGCDAVCVGTMMSFSSFLGLVGAPVLGSFSDRNGRRCALAVGCLGSLASSALVMCQSVNSTIAGLWLELVPRGLLGHNFTITKALVADVAPPDKRPRALGRLGIAAGMGFMLGPLLRRFISSLEQAAAGAATLQLIAVLAVAGLPGVSTPEKQKTVPEVNPAGSLASVWQSMRSAVELVITASPAAKLMLCHRFCLSIGYHIFSVFFQVIILDRFGLQPKDMSTFFAAIGLFYAIGQLVSGPVLRTLGDNHAPAVIICAAGLGVGRVTVAIASSSFGLYGGTFITCLALGVVNTSLNTTVTRIGDNQQLGARMGLLQTAERIAGVVGPTIGGFVYKWHEFGPLGTVLVIYAVIGITAHLLYPRWVVPAIRSFEVQRAEPDTKKTS